MVVGIAATVDCYAHDNEDLFGVSEFLFSKMGNRGHTMIVITFNKLNQYSTCVWQSASYQLCKRVVALPLHML